MHSNPIASCTEYTPVFICGCIILGDSAEMSGGKQLVGMCRAMYHQRCTGQFIFWFSKPSFQNKKVEIKWIHYIVLQLLLARGVDSGPQLAGWNVWGHPVTSSVRRFIHPFKSTDIIIKLFQSSPNQLHGRSSFHLPHALQHLFHFIWFGVPSWVEPAGTPSVFRPWVATLCRPESRWHLPTTSVRVESICWQPKHHQWYTSHASTVLFSLWFVGWLCGCGKDAEEQDEKGEWKLRRMLSTSESTSFA